VCVWRWLDEADRPAPGRPTHAQVGDGVVIPVGAVRGGSHSWWATVILLVVDFTVLASMAFAHLHLAMRLDVCPPPGAALPGWPGVAGAAAGLALSAALLAWSGRGLRHAALPRRRLGGLVAAAALAAASCAGLLLAVLDAGLAPRANGWSASLAALLGYQGFHLALMGLLAGFLGVRIWRGEVGPHQRASFDNTALLWWGGCLQGVIVALLPHAIAGVLS
jgi:cytochrome c oxidase subunit I+III